MGVDTPRVQQSTVELWLCKSRQNPCHISFQIRKVQGLASQSSCVARRSVCAQCPACRDSLSPWLLLRQQSYRRFRGVKICKGRLSAGNRVWNVVGNPRPAWPLEGMGNPREQIPSAAAFWAPPARLSSVQTSEQCTGKSAIREPVRSRFLFRVGCRTHQAFGKLGSPC